MALVLPQASAPHAVPKGHAKVPAASVPLKPGGVAETANRSPFHKLLEQLTKAIKTPEAETPRKLVKHGESFEKPKIDGKDVKDAKEVKDVKKPKDKVEPDLAWAAVLVAKTPEPPKPELVKAAVTEPSQAAEKTKHAERKTAAPAPQAVTVAAEATRQQQVASPPRAERSEERQKIFVVDRRTEPKEKEKLKLPGAEAAAQQPVQGPEAAPAAKLETKPVTEVQVSFQAVSGKPKDAFDLKPQAAPSPRDALTFQQYLVDKGYGQIVDQARIVLKDQNAGEIRMTLYPESLGKVKVALDLTDNTLAGQIFVENQTVKDVFQANLDGLKQAFEAGGWDAMSLQVSVGNGNGGSPSGEREAPSAVPARDYGRQVTQTGAEASTQRIASWSDRQINLTA